MKETSCHESDGHKLRLYRLAVAGLYHARARHGSMSASWQPVSFVAARVGRHEGEGLLLSKRAAMKQTSCQQADRVPLQRS
eukprot:7469550-Alexandrium_andersonii.AAC.1